MITRVLLLCCVTSTYADCPPVDTCPWDVNTTHYMPHVTYPTISVTSKHFRGTESFCAGHAGRRGHARLSRSPDSFRTVQGYLDWHTPDVSLGEIMRKNRARKLQKTQDDDTIDLSIDKNSIVKK